MTSIVVIVELSLLGQDLITDISSLFFLIAYLGVNNFLPTKD